MAGRRPLTTWRTTPGRMTITMIGLIAATVLWGVVATTGAIGRSDEIASVHGVSGPLAVNAQELYRALSDADAAAATAFLSAGAEPPDLRARYLDDIAAAGHAIVVASTDASADAKVATALQALSAGLPVYTGLVDTARTNNRLGYPVGAAYLRDASAYMQKTLLPSANDVYTAASERLNGELSDADGFPVWTAVLGVILLALLVVTQRGLSRRTRRTFNLGLVATSGALAVALIWASASWGATDTHLDASRQRGSDLITSLSNTRIAMLNARTDEALTLIARGSGGGYEDDYQKTIKTLNGSGWLDGVRAAAGGTQVADHAVAAADAMKKVASVHQSIQKADSGGDTTTAVGLATGTKNTDARVNWDAVDKQLDAAITEAGALFGTQSGDAGGSSRAIPAVVALLALLGAAGIGLGYQRRIAEYR